VYFLLHSSITQYNRLSHNEVPKKKNYFVFYE